MSKKWGRDVWFYLPQKPSYILYIFSNPIYFFSNGICAANKTKSSEIPVVNYSVCLLGTLAACMESVSGIRVVKFLHSNTEKQHKDEIINS